VQYSIEEMLSYNQYDGTIRWKIAPNLGYTKSGDIAGLMMLYLKDETMRNLLATIKITFLEPKQSSRKVLA